MRNRDPLPIQPFMFVYNMACVGLSIYMFIEIILSTVDAGYGFVCAPYNEKTRADIREMRVARVLWWYFFSKAIELNDTVLMVLRKKWNQITFLHVFHHATMLNIWWWVMTFIPGGLSCFGSGLNCLVHVVMYSYYGLTVIPALKGKLWWKSYITRFQLIQFCMTLSHTLYSIYVGCDFPQWGQFLLAGYMILMLVLFTNFYIHAYIIGRRRAEERRKQLAQSDMVTTVNGNGTQNGIQKHSVSNGHKNGVVSNGFGDSKKKI